MDELVRAKQQYFKLLRLVSKDHDLSFIVDKNKFFAVLGTQQRVILCQIRQDRWQSVQMTDFFELEEFLAKFLNDQKIVDDNLTKNIRLTLFGHSS